MYPVMFGRSTTASTIARISGSDVGYGPPALVGLGPFAGKLRFRSSDSVGGGSLIVAPS